MKDAQIETGKYLHYKGRVYEVFGTARHSETLEELVIYKNTENGLMWARPVSMWTEKVVYNGKVVPRFTKMD